MGRMGLYLVAVCSLGLWAFGTSAAAQDARLIEGPPELYGSDINYSFISAEEFVSTSASCAWQRAILMAPQKPNAWYPSIVDCQVVAPLHLPAGALVTSMSILYDNQFAGDMTVSWYRYFQGLGQADRTRVATWTSPGASSGWEWSTLNIEPDVTFAHTGPNPGAVYNHTLEVEFKERILVRGVIVQWRRQVSPGPATATFGDVPTSHAQFRFVEALAASGITGGCGGGDFCPNNPVTRGQMAVFLATALGLHYAP